MNTFNLQQAKNLTLLYAESTYKFLRDTHKEYGSLFTVVIKNAWETSTEQDRIHLIISVTVFLLFGGLIWTIFALSKRTRRSRVY